MDLLKFSNICVCNDSSSFFDSASSLLANSCIFFCCSFICFWLAKKAFRSIKVNCKTFDTTANKAEKAKISMLTGNPNTILCTKRRKKIGKTGFLYITYSSADSFKKFVLSPDHLGQHRV